MPDFPLPSFGPEIAKILGYAQDLIDLINTDNFLWAMAAFALAVTALTVIINMVKKPPTLDI